MSVLCNYFNIANFILLTFPLSYFRVTEIIPILYIVAQQAQPHCDNVVAKLCLTLSQRCGKV